MLEGGWSDYDGKWFQVSATGEEAFQNFLAEKGAAPADKATTVSTLLPVTGGTIWPVAGLRGWRLDVGRWVVPPPLPGLRQKTWPSKIER